MRRSMKKPKRINNSEEYYDTDTPGSQGKKTVYALILCGKTV